MFRRRLLSTCLVAASLLVTSPVVLADDLTGASRFLCSVISVVRCDADGRETTTPEEAVIPQFVIVDLGAAAGDAGKGSAIGAASGAVVGRHRKKQAEAQSTQQAQAQGQQAQQASAQQIGTFKKAFCACLEGKKYIAKY
jgi:hypothetical protein